jgi:hypothetical protein
MVPLFLVSVMIGMAVIPWISRYISAVMVALQQMNFIVLLAPLLIMLGISLISAYQEWMFPTSSSMYNRRRSSRDWSGAAISNPSSPAAGDYAPDHLGDSSGSGIGLFILALVLIPWR